MYYAALVFWSPKKLKGNHAAFVFLSSKKLKGNHAAFVFWSSKKLKGIHAAFVVWSSKNFYRGIKPMTQVGLNWKHRKYANIFIWCFHLVVLLIVTQLDKRGTDFWSPQGAAMLVCFSLIKSRKRLPCDIFDAFTTNASLVYDIADTDCWVPTLIFNTQDEKSGEKLLCVYSIIWAPHTFSVQFPFKGSPH